MGASIDLQNYKVKCQNIARGLIIGFQNCEIELILQADEDISRLFCWGWYLITHVLVLYMTQVEKLHSH